MVKNLDRLSDLLCGVIDLAELVRNVHPDSAWVEGANAAYEQLCEYMNELNVHIGLYEVSRNCFDETSNTATHVVFSITGPQIDTLLASRLNTL